MNGDSPPRGDGESPKNRVAELAATQFGRIRFDQLLTLGASETTIRRWRADGYLHPVLPRVYAVGHPGRSTDADLAAAVLYAGPHAMLSHGTAIWWLDLLRYPPDEIHVSTPRRVQSFTSVVVHPRRALDRTIHRGLPVTTISQALLDFAATDQTDLLRLALANADYHGVLNVAALQQLTGRGIPGTTNLNDALCIHLPQLAYTRSHAERRLLTLCQTHHLPIPTCNTYLHGHLIDAHWPHHHLIVEIDGHQGHRTPTQLHRDHQRDYELRQHGYTILRYTWRQLTETPDAIAAELRRYLA